jgi:hypothetical protein
LSQRELVGLCLAFVLTLPAVTARVYASDEIQYFSYLRSLWFDGDVSFENEYQYFYDRHIGRGENFHATFLELETDAGRRPNFGTMGAALLWAPFYACGDLTARVMRASGADVEVDGFSQPYIAAVAYGSALYGFAAIVLGLSAARRLRRNRPFGRPDVHPSEIGDHGNRADVLAAVIVWIGTPLLFYMYVAPPYAHAPSAFAVALFTWVWLQVRASWSPRGVVALGFAAALMAMVREQDAFLALGPAADFVVTVFQRGAAREAVLRAVAGTFAFLAGFAPQLIGYNALNGYPGPSRLVARKMSWHSPHAFDVLLSPAHGFLFWTPVAIVAIAGLVLLAAHDDRNLRRVGGCALLMVLMQVYVSGSVDSWTAAGAFGQRRFVAITVLLVIGLSTVLRVLPARLPRLATNVALALCVWWNLALTAAFGLGLMNRQRLELKRNAYDAFVTVPRLAPELALRYLTNRDSFYQSGQRQ